MKDKLQIAAILREASSVALLSHASPDGDCVGSMLSIGLALEKLGKKVTFYNPDPIPRNLTFLPGVERVRALDQDMYEADALLFLDCAEIERMNLAVSDLKADTCVINVDHHISNTGFGRWNWIEAQASATGELMYALIRELEAPLDEAIATNLYAAIATDTGSFRFSNITARTHQIVAELIPYIQVYEINERLFEQKPLAYTRLLQKALNSLEIVATDQEQIAFMTLSWQDFLDCGAEESLSEGLVNYARNIEGIEACALLRETKNGEIKVGLRSNHWLDVNEVAAILHGGGHKRAAGCKLKLPLREARSCVESALRKVLWRGRIH
ncbi:MAG: bifunctional oligoribonuclease/PAP phosphatase NrnA [Peptococcaceae bacterium]|jgi:phosphoesterase RecJ-like protein|nr:bifunctional oligoribonuclease/PAP phosphatase NrnA [Peptococcaceae bacterium]